MCVVLCVCIACVRVSIGGGHATTQELLSRTSLETQKLDLMDEVSYLKLKLAGMEKQNHSLSVERQHKAEVGCT